MVYLVKDGQHVGVHGDSQEASHAYWLAQGFVLAPEGWAPGDPLPDNKPKPRPKPKPRAKSTAKG